MFSISWECARALSSAQPAAGLFFVGSSRGPCVARGPLWLLCPVWRGRAGARGCPSAWSIPALRTLLVLAAEPGESHAVPSTPGAVQQGQRAFVLPRAVIESICGSCRHPGVQPPAVPLLSYFGPCSLLCFAQLLPAPGAVTLAPPPCHRSVLDDFCVRLAASPQRDCTEGQFHFALTVLGCVLWRPGRGSRSLAGSWGQLEKWELQEAPVAVGCAAGGRDEEWIPRLLSGALCRLLHPSSIPHWGGEHISARPHSSLRGQPAYPFGSVPADSLFPLPFGIFVLRAGGWALTQEGLKLTEVGSGA